MSTTDVSPVREAFERAAHKWKLSVARCPHTLEYLDHDTKLAWFVWEYVSSAGN